MCYFLAGFTAKQHHEVRGGPLDFWGGGVEEQARCFFFKDIAGKFIFIAKSQLNFFVPRNRALEPQFWAKLR